MEHLILGSSDQLACLPDRYRGRPGMAALRALLEDEAGPAFTRSEAERRCLEMLRSGGLPRPHANVPVGPYERHPDLDRKAR